MNASLNPGLFSVASRVFGKCRVINPGLPNTGYYAPDPRGDGTRFVLVKWGECYAASCPFCGDRRDRLAVNHKYGILDPRTGRKGYGLWKCFNKDCQKDPEHRTQVKEWLLSAPWVCRPTPTGVTVVPASTGPTQAAFYGEQASLADLPDGHQAVSYLRDVRGFDPRELAEKWAVGVITKMPPWSSWLEGRIVFPVLHDNVLVGWQARIPYDPPKGVKAPMKYFTHGSKSLSLYGLDAAAAAPVLAVFEGVTSVWRFGPGGLAGLGRGLSYAQVQLLAKRGGGRPVVMVPDQDDPDSPPAFAAAATQLVSAGYRGTVALLKIPDGTDPAVHPRPVLHAEVARAAAAG